MPAPVHYAELELFRLWVLPLPAPYVRLASQRRAITCRGAR
jgi:hypothetical protein